jgi:hypothetical protein
MNSTELHAIENLIKKSNYPLSALTISIKLKQTSGLDIKAIDIENYLINSNNIKIKNFYDGNLILFIFEGDDSDYSDEQIKEIEKEETQLEKDAYPTVMKFLKQELFVEANYTLFAQEKAIKSKRGTNKHRYPDLIGVYKPEWNELDTFPKLILKDISYQIYSFEVKTSLKMENIRESFFECLSNSVFANKRYVVIAKEGDKAILPKAYNEFRKLSTRYNVGLIEVRILDFKKLEYDKKNSKMLLDCPDQVFDYELFYDYLSTFPKPRLKEINNFLDKNLKL